MPKKECWLWKQNNLNKWKEQISFNHISHQILLEPRNSLNEWLVPASGAIVVLEWRDFGTAQVTREAAAHKTGVHICLLILFRAWRHFALSFGLFCKAAVGLPLGVLHRYENAFVAHLILPVFLWAVFHGTSDTHWVVASFLRVLHHTFSVQEAVFPVVYFETAWGDDWVRWVIPLQKLVADQAVLDTVRLASVLLRNVSVAVREKLVSEDRHTAVSRAA